MHLLAFLVAFASAAPAAVATITTVPARPAAAHASPGAPALSATTAARLLQFLLRIVAIDGVQLPGSGQIFGSRHVGSRRVRRRSARRILRGGAGQRARRSLRVSSSAAREGGKKKSCT